MAFRTKQDQVAEILRERIIAGAYGRGEKLKQADIAAELGVSITPVREALNILEAEGYVVAISHRGLLVPEIVAEEAREIYELRLILERELTVHALPRVTRDKLQELKRIQKAVVEANRARDRLGVRTANYRFHFRLYELAERPQTLQFVRVLWAKYPFTAQDRPPRRTDRMRQEHERFLALLEAGDRDGATEAMLDHIRSGWRELTESGVLAIPGEPASDTAPASEAAAAAT
jgi:DNA-binding GntR family transcriptional regulator